MVDIVDIELETAKSGFDNLIPVAKKHGVYVIFSYQNFTATPSRETIVQLMREEQDMGADLAKIAVMPSCPAEVLTLLCATQEMYCQYAQIPLITMSMGQMGLISRISGNISGSALTFALGKIFPLRVKCP
jgi:3-dehydroquinate dehydratase-1